MLASSVFHYIVSRLSPKKQNLTNFVSSAFDHETTTPEIIRPLVSIVVPTRDKLALLRPCVESILNKTDYRNFELIVIDNGSKRPETLQYLRSLELRGVRVSARPEEFNFSKLCNHGAAIANGAFICFVNNDVEVLAGNWLTSLVDHASMKSVGVVGATLVYPNLTVQHFGLVLGSKGIAAHVRQGEPLSDLDSACHQVSAVTFACALVSAKTWAQLGGLDEGFAVGLNDVDISLRARLAGLNNIQCSDAILVHRESQSRMSMRSIRGALTAVGEVLRFLKKHKGIPKDSFYSAS